MVTTIGQAIASRSQRPTGRNSGTVEDVWQRAVRSVDGMDLTVFGELLTGLWSGCGRKDPPDKTTMRVWYYCLHDLTEQQMAHAVMTYLTTRSKEFLTVQLIRELSGIQQAKELAAMEGWDLAIEAVRIAGSYAVPKFQDPVISNVIQNLGGWTWFCDQHPEQLRGFVRARFLKAYDVLAGSGKSIAEARLMSLTESGGGRSQLIAIGHKPLRNIIE